MTAPNPQPVRAEEPRDTGLEVPRTGFGLRGVMILTVAVMIAATLLVVLLYVSPLAIR